MKVRKTRLAAFGAAATLSIFAMSCGVEPSRDDSTSELMAGGSSACRTDPSINWRYAPANRLNQSVQEQAKAQVGNYVPNLQRHECTDLVELALRNAGARTRYQNPPGAVWPAVAADDYQWGTFASSVPVESGFRQVPEIVTPGDIVQFRNARFSYTIRNGNSTRTHNSHAAHHSAVVSAVSADRKHLCVLEQNPDRVHYGWYPMVGMTSGTVWFYRPLR